MEMLVQGALVGEYAVTWGKPSIHHSQQVITIKRATVTELVNAGNEVSSCSRGYDVVMCHTITLADWYATPWSVSCSPAHHSPCAHIHSPSFQPGKECQITRLLFTQGRNVFQVLKLLRSTRVLCTGERIND